MAHKLTRSQCLSLKINRIFDQLSVNDETIELRRKCFLQMECNETVSKYGSGFPEEIFYFGSQSEGTTTLGLCSDCDCVSLAQIQHVITSKKDSIPEESKYAFKMEKLTECGYCWISDLLLDTGTNFDDIWLRFRVSQFYKPGTLYLKNTFTIDNDWHGKIPEKEGPAIFHRTNSGECVNFLRGFACTSWPKNVANTFVANQTNRNWPSDHLLQDILLTKCFVVPKGSDTGQNSDIEWRLSFSCGERLLMFDLNILHIRCYILMKYIKSEFLDCVPHCKGIVSSYICKTVLFHTLSNSSNIYWLEQDLLKYLDRSLKILYKFLEEENCPHFIMPGNNLFANKLDEKKKNALLAEIQQIIKSDCRAVLTIKIDRFGELVRSDCTDSNNNYAVATNHRLLYELICHRGWYVFDGLCHYQKKAKYNFLSNNSKSIYNDYWIKLEVNELLQLYYSITLRNEKMTDSIKMWLCTYSTLVGSIMASTDIKNSQCLSSESFHWLLLGMQCTDVASAHLKLASILLLSGDLECTDGLIKDIWTKFNNMKQIVHGCYCKHLSLKARPISDIESILKKHTFLEIFKDNIAYCVVFVREEINSCPKELQYEMYRGALNEAPKGLDMHTSWVYMSSVPQLPFLYFLQYKLYKQIGNESKRDQALQNLMSFKLYKELWIQHIDTVLNLIGQCLEQEGKYYDALEMYYYSLKIEPEYNAAKILICCNIFTQFEKSKKNGHESS